MQSGGPLSSLTYRGELLISLMFALKETDSRHDGRGELRIQLEQGRNLLSLRADGTSDAFCTG